MKKFLNLYTLIAIAYACLMFSCAGSKKTKVDPYIGEWEYTAQTPNGDLDVVMTITKIETGYSGFLSAEMGSVDMSNLIIEEGNLTATFDIQGNEIPMKGKFDGDTYTGSTTWDGNERPMNATRKKTEE
jgi:hypothetical protein